MATVYDAAAAYVRGGFAPIPVPYKQKIPSLSGWPNLRLTQDDLPKYFTGGEQNIGLLNGKASGGLIDFDLDVREAHIFLGWLPPTGMIAGRAGSPASHHFYRATGIETTKYQDPIKSDARGMLIELRSTGSQTLVPPSIHPTGEPYTWERDGAPATVEASDLRRAAGIVAAGTLLARHWPDEGSRHDASLALIGWLLRHGWDDEETMQFVADVARAAGDEEWRERTRNVATTRRRLDNGAMATGAPKLIELLGVGGEQIVGRAGEWLGIDTRHEWAPPTGHDGAQASAPTATYSTPNWPDPPAAAAFYGLAGEVVAALEPTTEADPVALLVSFLAAVGNAIGPAPHWAVSGKRHGLRIYPVLVGSTSKGRKGTSWGSLRPLFEVAEPGWLARCVASGLSSGEGLIHAVRDPIEKREPVREGGKKTGRVLDYETVVTDSGVEDKRLLAMEEEFASVLKLMGREGNILSAVVRQAWDDGTLRTITKGNPETATQAHITITGHITKDELLRYLESTEAANGFANRFLWVCVKRSKLLPHGGTPNPDTFARLGRELEAVIVEAREYDLLRRDTEANAIWERVYGPLTEEAPGLFGAVTARAEAQVMRLAAIYAVLDRSKLVRAEHLQAALALWGYLEESARYIFGNATGDSVADSLYRVLRERGRLTRAEASDFFGRNVSAGRLDQAFELLRAAGKARFEMEQTGGRPAQVWYPT